MECDAERELEKVVTEAGLGMAVDPVAGRYDGEIRADANVVPGADRESRTRTVGAAASAAHVGFREADAGRQEHAARGLRIVVTAECHIPGGDGAPALGLAPENALAAEQQMFVEGPAHFEVACVRALATKSTAAIARNAVCSVPESEPDPKAFASLRM